MNLQLIVAELKKERDRIGRAIAALDQTSTRNADARKSRARQTKPATIRHSSNRGHLTAAGRKRLSQLMKQRWAERRRKASNGRKSAAKAA
jgi:hypothetical protein